jgi:hypothetical protein
MDPFKSRFGIACATFALAVAVECVWIAFARSRPPLRPGEQVERLVCRLEEKGARLHVVPVSTAGDYLQGVYLCAAAARREDLEVLRHTPEDLFRWRGVVFVGRCFSLAEEDRLGDSTAVIASCRLFGDPDLVADIRRVLGED